MDNESIVVVKDTSGSSCFETKSLHETLCFLEEKLQRQKELSQIINISTYNCLSLVKRIREQFHLPKQELERETNFAADE